MDNRKKRGISWKKISRKKKAAVLAVLLVGAGDAAFLVMRQQRMNQAMASVAREATETVVTRGDLSDTIVGTGNLEADASIEVKIPTGIVIDEITVESGDTVAQGDVLAYVNEASVLSAMEEVQDSIEVLDTQIQETKEETEETSITAAVEGRVKRIFLAEGQEVAECMLENGALMILSLDGYLGVKVETVNGLTEGDTVTVTRSDGSTVTGSVDTINGESCTVLLSDAGVGMEEEVTVTDANGQSMGTGVTYVNEPLTVTGTSGVVQSVSVTEDQQVYAETELYTLEEDENTASYRELTAQREELVNTLQTLVALSQSGTITASEAGTVEEIQVTEGNDSSSGSTGDSGVQTMAYTGENTVQTTGALRLSSEENTDQTSDRGQLFSADDEEEEEVEHTPSATETPTPEATETPALTPTPSLEPEQSDEDNQEYSGDFTYEDSDLSTGTDGNTNVQDNGQSNGTQSGADSSYSSMTTAFVLASEDTVMLTVNVDELDINSVEKEQEAEITLDALEGETFTGSVTKIGNTASSGGGVTKYTVEITLDKDERMKEGMNASATIIIEKKEQVLTLPVSALQERGSEVFVYTEKDEDGNLSGEQTVTTGLSDGETVEIVEGLSEGDTVYYQRSGGASSGSEENSQGMPGGGGSEMPDMSEFGGEAPGDMGGQFGGRE